MIDYCGLKIPKAVRVGLVADTNLQRLAVFVSLFRQLPLWALMRNRVSGVLPHTCLSGRARRTAPWSSPRIVKVCYCKKVHCRKKERDRPILDQVRISWQLVKVWSVPTSFWVQIKPEGLDVLKPLADNAVLCITLLGNFASWHSSRPPTWTLS